MATPAFTATNSAKEASRTHHIKAIIIKAEGKQRLGKGFSPDEVKQAGLNRGEARRLGVPVDTKRKSAHAENISTLKAHKEKAPPIVPKPKPAVEKLVSSKKKPKS